MGIDFKRCDLAAGRIHLEASRLLASEGGIRTAEGMLSGLLKTDDHDVPRGFDESADRSAIVTITFFRRLRIALDACGHHLGLHLALEDALKAANRSAGIKPAQPPAPQPPVDPEALRKRDLDQKRLLTSAEVAYILQCSERRVLERVKAKKLRCVEITPNAKRFRPADVDKYISRLAGDRPPDF